MTDEEKAEPKRAYEDIEELLKFCEKNPHSIPVDLLRASQIMTELLCAKEKEIEKDVKAIVKENEILKNIISTILDKDDICYICQMKGQVLSECMRMENSECLKNMISLWSK